jgi:uncharacterized protein YcfL
MRSILIVLLLSLVIVGCESKPRGENVPLDKVSETVMKVANEKLPDVKFDQAWKTPSGNYEVRGKAKNGKARDIQIKPNGEVVEID